MQKQFRVFILAGLFVLLAGLFSSISLTRPAQAACATMPTDKGTVTVSASAPSAGTYYLWSRNKAPATNNNGYYLQVDGNCGITVGDAVIPVNTWTWVNYQNGSSSNRISMSLTAGTHTFTFYGLDPGVLVDRLVLTSDSSCTPAETGANCAGAGGSSSTTTPSSTVQVGSADPSSKTKIIVDGKQVAAGNGLVNLDTSKLSDGYHDITVLTTDANGVTHATTKRILVKNHPHWWQQPHNVIYRLAGEREWLARFILAIIGAFLFGALGLGFYIVWDRRLWQKVPGLRKLKILDKLHPVRAKPTATIVDVASHSGKRPIMLRDHSLHVSLSALSVVVSMAIIGALLVTVSFAATPAAFTVDPEKGSLSGVTKGTDTAAADGSYIQFGSGTVGSTPASCPAGQTGTPPNCVTPPSPPATCPAGQIGTPPNCTTPTTGAVPCALTTAAESCWATHTGVPGYTEAQIVAGQSNLTHVTSQATAPAGTTYNNGNLTVTTNGATINRVWLDGCIAIKANNVTISNSLIHDTNQHGCAGGDQNAAPSSVNTGGCTGGAGTKTGLTIIDSEVDAGNGTGDYTGIAAGNYHLTRVNMHGGTKAAWAGCNVVIEESYGHGLSPNAGAIHEDTIDADTSVFVTVTHSWLSAVGGQATTGAMIFNTTWGTAHDGTVTNCFLQGGNGADARFGEDQYNMKITGNAFSNVNGYGGTDFFYGWANNPGNVWSGNYVPETGKTIDSSGVQH